MPKSPHSVRAAVATLALGLLVAGCETGDELLLASAAGHRLTVDETVGLMASATRIPAEPAVVETVADLWVDYTLLAEAMAEDSTLAHLDMTPLVRQQTDVETIMALRDSLVSADTTVTEAELEAFYARTGSGLEARVRHILVAFPPGGPTTANIDSVRSRAAEIRRRIVEGEDFERLAREYSQDSGSARSGGDLGWIAPGQMVEPLDAVAFDLEEGEVSEPVRTDFGFHVVRVDDTRVTGLEAVRDEMATALRNERMAAAESTFVAGIMAESDVRLAEDGLELVRRLASQPRTELSGRAEERTVARYAGGEISAGEVRDFMLTRQPGYRVQVVEAGDSLLREVVIDDLVRREMLLARAEEAGLEMSASVVDSLTSLARDRFAGTARQLGLANVEVQPGESRDAAIGRAVNTRIRNMLLGRTEVIPVGAVGFVLRRHYPSEVHRQVAVARVVEGVERARGPGGASGAGGEGLPGATGAPGTDGSPAPGGSAAPGGGGGAEAPSGG